MRDILALIFIVLFGVSTVLTYLAVRRRWMRVLYITLLGILVDTVAVMWASVARGIWLPQAALTGLMLGIMFTAMTVSISMFYRANPPGQLPNPPRKPAITPVSALSSRSEAAESPAPSQPPQPPR